MTIANSAPPSHANLADAIHAAARSAITSLFQSHQDHHFYYCALLTTGDALAPTLTAWSTEALDLIVATNPEDTTARSELKWSPIDSPFYAYGDEDFENVKILFSKLPAILLMPAEKRRQAFEFRVSAMEQAINRLDHEGLFGHGTARARIVVNVELVPPDHTNTERALRLNPRDALAEWLDEAAEP